MKAPKKETKSEDAPKVAVEETPVPEVKQFDFGTIVLKCKCGRKQSLMEHVQYGIQFIIATNEKSGLTLHCDKCHRELRLECEEGTAPPEAAVEDAPGPQIESIEIDENISESKIDEDIPEESKEVESL